MANIPKAIAFEAFARKSRKSYRFPHRKTRKSQWSRGNHQVPVFLSPFSENIGHSYRQQQRNPSVHGALCCFTRPRRPGRCARSRSCAATSAGPGAGRFTASWMQLLSTEEKWQTSNEMFQWIQDSLLCLLLEDALLLGDDFYQVTGSNWENCLQYVYNP